MPIITDVLRRVFVTSETAYLEIGPYPDCSDTIELRTTDEASKEWFGKHSIIMSPEYAIALGQALIASAQDMQKGKT